MKFRLLFFTAVFQTVTVASAQEKHWTLEACIAYAYEHNIEIKQQELTAESKRLPPAEAKWSY